VTRWATNCLLPRDQLVVETLMVALHMIVSQVLVERIIGPVPTLMTPAANSPSMAVTGINAK
jgi:hypothetical protein